jgi:hypothetical protein
MIVVIMMVIVITSDGEYVCDSDFGDDEVFDGVFAC